VRVGVRLRQGWWREGSGVGTPITLRALGRRNGEAIHKTYMKRSEHGVWRPPVYRLAGTSAAGSLCRSSRIMRQLVYVSSSKGLFSAAALDDILKVSRRNNARLGITGILLYRGGNIMQVLEGEWEPLERLYQVIREDPRHTGLIKLVDREVAKRDFEFWSMDFQDLAAYQPGPGEESGDFLAPGWDLAAIQPSKALKLVLQFRRTHPG